MLQAATEILAGAEHALIAVERLCMSTRRRPGMAGPLLGHASFQWAASDQCTAASKARKDYGGHGANKLSQPPPPEEGPPRGRVGRFAGSLGSRGAKMWRARRCRGEMTWSVFKSKTIIPTTISDSNHHHHGDKWIPLPLHRIHRFQIYVIYIYIYIYIYI